MAIESSLRNAFRFVQLRPTTAIPESHLITLKADSELCRRMISAKPADRHAIAHAFLEETTTLKVDDLPGVAATIAIVDSALGNKDATYAGVRQALAELDAFKDDDVARWRASLLSDVLLAVTFAGPDSSHLLPGSSDRIRLTKLYQAHALSTTNRRANDDQNSAYKTLRRPIALPDRLQSTGSTAADPLASAPQTQAAYDPSELGVSVEDIFKAIDEISNLDQPKYLRQPDAANGVAADVVSGVSGLDPVAFSLTDEAARTLSEKTVQLLKSLNLHPQEHAVDELVTALETRADVGREPSYRQNLNVDRQVVSTPKMGAHLHERAAAYVHQTGIADLLVVKQQVKHYEATEIAHVENLSGSDSGTEETISSGAGLALGAAGAVESTDRFELNRETKETLRNDRGLGFDLSVADKYGPTIEFSPDRSMEAEQSQQRGALNATTYAQDVVDRSLARVIDGARSRPMLPLNLQSNPGKPRDVDADGASEQPVAEVYQFLETIYESQVFSYGVRQMFDFVIPEPASFLWHMGSRATDGSNILMPPEPLSAYVRSWSDVSPQDYKSLEVKYGADEILPPPPRYISVKRSINRGDGSRSEGSSPRNFEHLEVEVPAGYKPTRAKATAQAFTDSHPQIFIQVGHNQKEMDFSTASCHSLAGSTKIGRMYRSFVGNIVDRAFTESGHVGIDIYGFETATYSVQLEIICQRDESLYKNWQKQAYKKLSEGYDARLREQRKRMEALQGDGSLDSEGRGTGEAPSRYLKLILTELKKHCISMITRQWYDTFSPTTTDSPPRFELNRALEEGQFVRFFEQAFEWDQMQYVFYPYYWGNKEAWVQKFLRSDLDPMFQEFLQSGSARVVVPVRPGFELVINHFMETGNVWSGDGAPPAIGSRTYVSILDEIFEKNRAPQDEVPIGDAWEIRVPTRLVLRHERGALPSWVRDPQHSWKWKPKSESDSSDSQPPFGPAWT